MSASGFGSWIKRIFGGNAETAAISPVSPSKIIDASDEVDYVSPALRNLIAECGLDFATMWPMRYAARVHIESGDPRKLDSMLRTVLPTSCWEWPAYAKWAAMVGERPTRIRMVAAFASTLMKRNSAQIRAAQLIANVDRRPYWELRAVGDGADWPLCRKHDRRVERWDHRFWVKHGPHQCERVGCRCSIRALTPDEYAARKVH